MKNIIERIAGGAKIARYLPKAVSTRLAIAALAALAAGGAGAAAGDTVTICNDLSTGGFATSTPTYTANDSYTITIPAVSGLSAGDYVRVSSFTFGRNSAYDAMNVAYVTSKDFLGDTIRSGDRTESGKFSKVSAWKEICAFGSAGDDNDLLLKVGTAYDFSLLNSSGAKTAQKVLAFTTTDGTYSPVAQDTTSTDTRMEQEVVCKVVSSAVVSASGTWSGLAFSNAPGDWSAATTAPVLVELTADSTLEINTDVNVESIVFAVPANVTLTLTGSKAITATTAISIKGGGSVCVAAGADVLSGPVKVASGTTFTFDFANVAAPTEENPFGDALLAACSFSVLGSAQFSNVPANTIASIGDCGIRLVHNSVFGKWNATGQSMYAWRSPGTSGNFSTRSVAPVTTSSGAVGSTEQITWSKFCSGNGSYSAPAPAFYFDSAEYSMQRTPDFSPLTIGGLLVTAGGSTITRSDGQLELGDTRSTDAKIETYFVLAQSFGLGDFGKGGSYPNKIYGTVNIEAAEGATLTLPSQGITLDTATAANLKMHGAGNIALTGTITATGNVTLDYSDVDSGNTFIRGSLTVDVSTKLVLPSGLSEGTPYTLCTGTLTAPSMVTEGSVQIGDGEATTATLLYNTTEKTVAYYTSIPEFTGTVSGSTIAWDSEPTQEQYAIGKIVLTGSGDVTLPYEPFAISAGSGVTVDVTGYKTAAYSGEGTFKYTSGYPTAVPANNTFAFVGGADAESEVTFSSAVAINGTLKTYGFINLSGQNTLSAGGTLEVVTGQATVTTVAGTQANNWSGGFGGTITIDTGATFVNTTSDALKRNSSQVVINVYGTLSMGSTRWTMQSSQYHRLNLHGNAEVKGSGDGYGILDFENANSSYVNINVYDGTPTISGPLRFRAKTITWIEANAKLAVTGGTISDGEFAKSGAGTLSFSAVAPSTSGGLSASAGTIELDNISYTAGTITLSSAQNSPTLKMIATDAATTVSAAVNVPANTRGQLAFEGAGTFALSGPNRDNNIVWLGTNPVSGTLQLNDNVAINNGGVNNNYRFNKLGSGSSTLSLSAWSTCYDKNGNPGLGYTFDTIDADAFTGTIALSNSATDSRGGCTMNFSAVNIIKSSAVYGTPLVKVTKAVGARTDSYSNAINVSATQFNGNAAEFVYDDSVVGSEGIYLAEASYNGVNYKTLAAAVSDAKAASADPSAITVYNASATVPSGYALVTAAGGAMTLRSAGNGELIYWASGNSGDWSGEASKGTHTFYTVDGEVTPYVTGDTVVITNDVQIWSKTAAHGAKFQIGTDTAQAEVHFTRSGDNCNDYILDGSTIEIKSGSTLVAERYGDTEPPTQAYTQWNSYNSHNGSEIKDTTITGAGTFKVGGDTGGHGAAAAILSGTTSISCAIDLADGATLTVPSGCTVTVPTTSVADKMVTCSTDSGTGTKTYSVVPTVARLVNGETETPYADIITALGNLIQVLIANPAAYVQVLDGTAELANEYGAHGIGLDASTRRYVKAVAISGNAGYTTVQAAIDAVANEGSVTLKADCNDVLTLADGKTVTIVAKVGGATYTYTSPVAATPSSYRVIAGETVDGATTFTSKMFYTVTIPAGVEHASATVNGDAVAGGASVQVDVGSNVTIAWTAASGYKITAGATQTINAIATDVTATAPAVEAKGATVSDVAFDYGKDFATATVTATVSGDATAYTLTVGGTDYPGTVDGTTVTFSNVVTGHSSAYDSVSYEIAATDGTSPVVVSGGSGAAPVADVTADWINERAASATGTSASASDAGGAWTNAVTYTDGTAAISDNRFVATTASTASRVVLEFNVCFSSVSDADVDGDAQGALKLGEVNSVTTFMVLTNGNQWAAVSNVGLTPDPTATNKVVMTFDYANNTYSVSVDNYELTDGSGSSSFPLAASRTGVKDIDFAGMGTLVSMKGDQLEGYMVVDKNGKRYPSIAAAISAYTQDPSIGPLRVLHSGTAPSGWRIDGDTLIKAAKGLFFMAF